MCSSCRNNALKSECSDIDNHDYEHLNFNEAKTEYWESSEKLNNLEKNTPEYRETYYKCVELAKRVNELSK